MWKWNKGPSTNPATGLPMQDDDSSIDVGGNPFGIDMNDTIDECELIESDLTYDAFDDTFDSGLSDWEFSSDMDMDSDLDMSSDWDW